MMMSLKMRILMLPLLAALTFGCGIAAVIWFSAATSQTIRAVGAVDYPFLDASTRLASQVNELVGTIQGAVAEGSADRLDEARERHAAAARTVAEIKAIAGKDETGARIERELGAFFTAAIETAQIILGKAQGDQAAAVQNMQAAQKTLDASLAHAVADGRSALDGGISKSQQGVTSSLWAIVACAVLVVAGLGAGSLLLARSIWRQIGGEPAYAREAITRIANGDLSHEIHVDAGDHHSVLGALHDMVHGISAIVSTVRIGSDSISAASQQIAGGNMDLSNRTEMQAAALGTTAGSVSDLSQAVNQNAENASQANHLALGASSIAVKGGEVVSRVVSTMGEINASSKRIADIIGVIDGIAFQTNILALNAAVEAARAGEQGRGFAVVAGEVRSLAQRTAAAAREIKGLIQASVERVEQGTALVGQAGSTMGEIVAAIQRVTGIMSEISQASGEQSSGVSRLGQAVAEMDETTQQNAALVEQSAAASESLRQQAQQLVEAVAAFKLAPA
jgi:methyl-accepting chemotaxis protein